MSPSYSHIFILLLLRGAHGYRPSDLAGTIATAEDSPDARSIPANPSAHLKKTGSFVSSFLEGRLPGTLGFNATGARPARRASSSSPSALLQKAGDPCSLHGGDGGCMVIMVAAAVKRQKTEAVNASALWPEWQAMEHDSKAKLAQRTTLSICTDVIPGSDCVPRRLVFEGGNTVEKQQHQFIPEFQQLPNGLTEWGVADNPDDSKEMGAWLNAGDTMHLDVDWGESKEQHTNVQYTDANFRQVLQYADHYGEVQPVLAATSPLGSDAFVLILALPNPNQDFCFQFVPDCPAPATAPEATPMTVAAAAP